MEKKNEKEEESKEGNVSTTRKEMIEPRSFEGRKEKTRKKEKEGVLEVKNRTRNFLLENKK